jgi:hypothetical protein
MGTEYRNKGALFESFGSFPGYTGDIWQCCKLGVFAYPRKKVQSRISSRLENDALPLLSVFIDNMHVDEVQINGGGTEAVITGNMENPGKRLIVLEGDAVEALYGRPLFTHEERVQYFALSPKEKSVLDQDHWDRFF